MITHYTRTLSGDQFKKLRQFQADNFLPDTSENNAFYETFNSELERELAKAQTDWVDVDTEIDVAKGVVLETVTQDFQNSVDYQKLKFGLKERGITVKVETGNDGVRFTAEVKGYLGRTGRGNTSNRDVGYLGRVFVDPVTIPFNSVEGLSIIREGKPSFTPIEQLEGKLQSVGQELKATHLFKQGYEALIPQGMLPEVYVLHGPQAKG